MWLFIRRKSLASPPWQPTVASAQSRFSCWWRRCRQAESSQPSRRLNNGFMAYRSTLNYGTINDNLITLSIMSKAEQAR